MNACAALIARLAPIDLICECSLPSAGLDELMSEVSLSCIVCGRSGSEGQSQIVRASSPRIDQGNVPAPADALLELGSTPSCWSRPRRGSPSHWRMGLMRNRPVCWPPH
jgi:hypothetical protein